jgi:nucleoside-diphosphate-sugar epimerase
VPRVLIAGFGYVGEATADLFQNAGWTVEGWTRSAGSAAKSMGKAYPVIAVDITQRDQVNARPENFDAIIHCASTRGGHADLYRQVYLNGARNLLDRFVGSTLLFTSSTSVYAQKDGAWVTEESPAQPEHEAGRVLRETEQLVLSSGGIVARLAGIYGPGRSALLTKFLGGKAVIDPENDRFTNQVHRDDIATALFSLLDRQLQPAQIYNVVDDQPILRSECYRWLAEKLDRPLPPSGRSTSQPRRGQGNKRVSNAKLRGITWVPRYPSFAEAMEKSILPSFGL